MVESWQRTCRSSLQILCVWGWGVCVCFHLNTVITFSQENVGNLTLEESHSNQRKKSTSQPDLEGVTGSILWGRGLVLRVGRGWE